jgi:hypothetical protein
MSIRRTKNEWIGEERTDQKEKDKQRKLKYRQNRSKINTIN